MNGKPRALIDLAIPLVLVLLAAAIYAQVRDFAFITWDDRPYVLDNPPVMKGLTFDGLRWAFTAVYMNNWHPLTWISHMVDVALFGTWAGGHHLMNVFWHALNAVLLYALLRGWTGAVARSAVVAALFAVHPMHVESVAWVAERKDVLSAFFWLLTLHAYAFYLKKPSWPRHLAVTLAFGLGLMAKPMLVSLPLILLLLDHWPYRRIPLTGGWREFLFGIWPLLREKALWVAMAAASVVVTLHAQGAAMMPAEFVGTGLRLGNALRAVGVYLWLTVWPSDLSYFYPIYPLKAWQIAAALAAVVGISAFAWRERVRRPWLLVGWAWFLVVLLPVIGIVKVGAQAYADRYVYLPHIGLFVAMVWTVAPYFAATPLRRRAGAALATVVVVAAAATAWQQTRLWRDSETLYLHALRLDPKNVFAEMMLAETYFVLGPRERGEAMAVRIVRASPGAAVGLTGLAFDAIRAGKYDEAAARCRAVLAVLPAHAPALHAFGLALQGRGDLVGALEHLQRAVTVDPRRGAAWQSLAVALASAGQAEAAARAAEQARWLQGGAR